MKIYTGYPGGITKITNDKGFYQTEDLVNVISVYVNQADVTGITYTLALEFLRADGRKTTIYTEDRFASGEATTLTEENVTYDIHNFTLTDTQLAVAGALAFTCYINILNSGVIEKRGVLFNAVSNVRKTVLYSANTIFVVSEDEEDVPIIVADMKTAIETLSGQLASKVNKADIADDLTTNNSSKVLSAKQGYILKAMIDALDDSKADKADVYNKDEVDIKDLNLADQMASDKLELNNRINITNGILTATQAEVAKLKSVQNVVEVVATKSALNSYDTTKLDANDKVQVITDETHDGASTIYNWSGSAWQYVGAYGTNSYTKQEINNYKKMWDNLVYSCEFTIDDSAKTMTISGNWAFTKYSFIVIDNIAVKTISYANLSLGNYCLVIRNNALEFVNFANAIQDGDMVLWIGFLDSSGDIRTDIYRCNNKVTNLALYCSDNIKIDTTNKNFVIPSAYLFWNSGYASISAQNISYSSYLNATCVLVYRNGVFKVLGLQNIELFYNDVIVAVVWFRSDGFPMSKVYVVNEAPDKAITELPLSSKIFMRVGVIGDSYTSGWIKDNDHKNNPNFSWVKHMKQLTGNEWTNFGVSGSSTKSWVDGTLGQLPQVQTKGNKCQAYVIGLMINDQNQGMQTYVPLGTSSDIGTNANSYYAYYYKLINALLSVNSSAIIFCNTCPRTDGDFPSYNQAVIDVVNYCQSESKNVYLVELRNYYWRNETFNNDALNGHYTAIGYEYMAEIFNKAFSDTINANASSLKEVNLIPYDSATVYDYVDQKINDLRWELGSHTLDVESDTTTSFSKSVPSGAIGCQINKVGGMSYKSENFEGIRDSAVTSVVSKGANLLNMTGTSVSKNGITFSYDSATNTFSYSGTLTYTSAYCNLNAVCDLVNGNSYIFKLFGTLQNGTGCQLTAKGLANNGDIQSGGTTYVSVPNLSKGIPNAIMFYIRNGTIGTEYNGSFKLMVIKGSTAPTEFKAYRGTIDTLTIHTAIQNLTGYGWGINDTCYNYIDFDRKVFVQKVGRVDLGSLTWQNDNSFVNCFFASVSDKSPSSVLLLTNYENLGARKYAVTLQNDTTLDKCICCDYNTSSKIVIIKDTNYTTAATFKTAMSGVYLYYELATPIETDISAYLTRDTIDVEPLGTLEFTNTYNNDVPSDIDYLIEEVKA